MLETRLPPVSTLPRPPALPSQRPTPARTASARTASARPIRTLPFSPPSVVRERERRAPATPRTAAQRLARTRLARSEARLLTVAVPAMALLCAVLVIYLAAYAHVSQLGVDQAQAQVQLRQARLENDKLQAHLAALQSPSHIAAAAQALGMTAGAKRVTYLFSQSPQTPPNSGARNVQVAIGGTTTDTPSTDGH